MKPLFRFFVLALLLLSFSASAKKYFQQQTQDSIIDQEECNEKFFATCDPALPKTLMVLKNKKTVSLKNFFNFTGADTLMGMGTHQGLKDLDQDGKKELILYDYTGGAHCCDEYYVFKNIAPNKYQYVAKTFAGDVCINNNNEFIYSFYQQYGYFFTCFACGFSDTTDAGPQSVASIALRYNKGKLAVVPGNMELKNKIMDNLGKLKEYPYQKLQDEADQDDGLRKEFALNLVVYYYSFGKNIGQTKILFDKYYKFPDAKTVWKEFVQILNGIKSESDF
ncbi:MAG: hypothetical protein JST17_02330 [Bacteroidetes bacterium]|nr:hypothetical protein [Bacteroidota bacterium]MBS1931335.1 hypothetical protein [Bacteroidota bacterium]